MYPRCACSGDVGRCIGTWVEKKGREIGGKYAVKEEEA